MSLDLTLSAIGSHSTVSSREYYDLYEVHSCSYVKDELKGTRTEMEREVRSPLKE